MKSAAGPRTCLLFVSAFAALPPAFFALPPPEARAQGGIEWPVRAEEGKGGCRFSIRPMAGLRARPGAPLPLVAIVTNVEPSFAGTITAFINAREANGAVTRKISIGPGRFRFTLYPEVPGSGQAVLRVELRDTGGRILQSRVVELSVPNAGQAWVGVADARDRRVSPEVFKAMNALAVPLRGPEALPDRWCGYEMFDAILWDAGVDWRLDAQQKRALADWIQMGGRLIVHASPGDDRFNSPVPERLPSFDIVAAGYPGGDGTWFSSRAPGVEDGKYTMELGCGLGSVALLKHRCGDPAQWRSVNPGFALGYVEKAGVVSFQAWINDSAEAPAIAAGLREPSPLDGALAASAGYRELSFRPIMITMIVFILVVSLGDYLVLRMIRRLQWTWFTFPALIAAFSIFSYIAFYEGAIKEDARHELVFEDIGPDGRGRALTLSCIRKKNQRPCEFSVNEENRLKTQGVESPMQGMPTPAQGNYTVISEISPGGTEKTISIPGLVGSYKFFSEEWTLEKSAQPLAAELVAGADGRLVSGRIRAADKAPAPGAFVVYKRQVYPVGRDGDLTGEKSPLEYMQAAAPAAPAPGWGWGGRSYYNVPGVNCSFDSMGDWVKRDMSGILFQADMLCAKRAGAAPPDRLGRLLSAGDHAVVVAFVPEEVKYGGIRTKRMRCIRQVVPVAVAGGKT